MERAKLTREQADEVEFSMRQLEADPNTTLRAMRLFMQSVMPCGHAVGNLLTCDRPPNGCVICGEASVNVTSAMRSLHSEGDWTEDFSHENGNYMNKYIRCGNEFVGHKRRVVCRVCHEIHAEGYRCK